MGTKLGSNPSFVRLATRLGRALLCVLLVGVRGANADVVELPISPAVTGTGWFQAGEPSAPAVLVLHGFLQTRDYLTVRSLAANLSDHGYSVLLPTLSLGIDRRRSSMACEAVHAHSLQDDLAEIEAWVRWLEAQGYRDIRLVGHSHGSLQLLAYLHGDVAPSVKQLIATSLLGIDQVRDSASFVAQRDLARQQVRDGERGLQPYKLSYCDRYMASPTGFLSYADWDGSRVLEALQAPRVPVQVILGSHDARMQSGWSERLTNRGVAVTLIEGAGHFFDSEYEFDLLDGVAEAIDAVPGDSR